VRKEINSSAGLKGRLKIAVLDNGHVVEERPWQDNLILDQGLDYLATYQFNQLFTACCVGNGTDPTDINPNTTATVSGTTLTATAGYFTSSDLDSDVHFSTGQYAKIQSVTSPTVVTLFSPLTVSTPTPFTVLRTNQTILDNEMMRTVQCATTPGANSAVVSPAQIVLQRTFLFPPEAVTTTYSEVGFSPITTPGSNLYSRVLLASPITLQGPASGAPLGQQLQVTYTLTIGFDMGAGFGVPVTGRNPYTFSITGLPINRPIFQWASDPNFTGKLAAYIYPPSAFSVGDTATVKGSNTAAYNGTWSILNVSNYNDSTHGPSQIITLNTAFSTAAADPNAILTTTETGQFFRPCFGIYLINANGGSAAPANTPNLFQGYGEPSVAGTAWISADKPANLGNNNAPVAPTINVQTAACQLLSYASRNFYIDKQVSFTLEFNTAQAFGIGAPDLTNQIETYTWDQGHALGATSVLELTFRFSWNRTTF
jgi:hypothetical protein